MYPTTIAKYVSVWLEDFEYEIIIENAIVESSEREANGLTTLILIDENNDVIFESGKVKAFYVKVI